MISEPTITSLIGRGSARVIRPNVEKIQKFIQTHQSDVFADHLRQLRGATRVKRQPDARHDLQDAHTRSRRIHGNDILERQSLQDHEIAVRRAFDQSKSVMRHRHVLRLRMLRTDLQTEIE